MLDSIPASGSNVGQGSAVSRGCHRSRRICSVSRMKVAACPILPRKDLRPRLGVFRPASDGRVALTFTMIVLAACVVAAALLFSHALNDRHAIRDRALSTAVALSFGFDQEVAAGNALLKGLSSSPALRAGRHEGFLRSDSRRHRSPTGPG